MTSALAGRCAVITLLAASLAGASPARAFAQERAQPLVPELRADVIAGDRSTSVQGAVGVQIPWGNYVRVGVLAGAGVARPRGGDARAAGRFDVLGRFLLDPFRQARWGLSAGAGVGVTVESGDHVRPQLLAALDLEGPRSSSGVSPAFQLGLGGGVRAGVALRRSGRLTR